MKMQDVIAEAMSKVDAATPADVKPVGQMHASTPFKWSVVALIGNLIAVFALAVYIALQVFDSIVFNHPEPIVLAQIANQRTIAIATFVLLGIDTLAIVYAATSVAFSGSIGVASFHMGAEGRMPAPPVKVDVQAPPGVPVEVNAPPPATVTQDEHPQPDPEIQSVASLPLKGHPTEYGD